jgi:hypothetical protein
MGRKDAPPRGPERLQDDSLLDPTPLSGGQSPRQNKRAGQERHAARGSNRNHDAAEDNVKGIDRILYTNHRHGGKGLP